jgi:hypothetical protein
LTPKRAALERKEIAAERRCEAEAMEKAIAQYLQERNLRIEEFDTVIVPSERYHNALKRLQRITMGFIDAHRALALYTSRQPNLYNRSLMYAFSDDLLESAVDVATGISIGTHHAARRELRYLLEHAVKTLYVDQQQPSGSLEARFKFLDEQISRGSIDVVDDLSLAPLGPTVQEDLIHDVKGLFAEVSAFVHPSLTQLRLRLKRQREGRGAGFDSAEELESASKVIFRVYDIVLFLLCHGIGIGMAGDLFINVWDEEPKWAFHKGKFMSQLSKHFDYKHERRSET